MLSNAVGMDFHVNMDCDSPRDEGYRLFKGCEAGEGQWSIGQFCQGMMNIPQHTNFFFLFLN